MEQKKRKFKYPHHMVAWFKGEVCNFLPPIDFWVKEEAIKKWVLDGWLPKEPFSFC